MTESRTTTTGFGARHWDLRKLTGPQGQEPLGFYSFLSPEGALLETGAGETPALSWGGLTFTGRFPVG